MVAYTHGGGAFVLPYLLALVLVTVPMVLLEFSLGKVFQLPHVLMLAKISKKSVGTGWYAVIGVFFIAQYYQVLLAYVLIYLLSSFQDPLPWTADPSLVFNATSAAVANAASAKVFFSEQVQESSGSIDAPGGCVTRVTLAYLIIWFMTFVGARKGASSIGKMSQLLMPLPFIIIVIFLIRGFTLRGASSGVAALFTPDLALLAQPSTWSAAVSQILFSASAGLSTLTTYASYLPSDALVVRNAAIVCLTNSLFSIAAGIAVFSFIGHLSFETAQPLGQIVTAGPALAFEVFPIAISLLPLPQLWSVLFFVMLLNLGIPSAVSMTTPLCVSVTEIIAPDRPNLVAALIHFMGFLSGLMYTSHAGGFWLHISDHFVPLFLTICVALSECLVVSILYGARKLVRQLAAQDRRGEWFWVTSWRFILPCVLSVLLVLQIISEAREPFSGYPAWAIGIGSILAVGPTLFIPIFFVFPHLARNYVEAEAEVGGPGSEYVSSHVLGGGGTEMAQIVVASVE